MASWQAHLTSWLLKGLHKPRLRLARNAMQLRRILVSPPFQVPKEMRITPGRVGGVAGEWVEAAAVARATMLYLHGGGYFAMSAKSHRAITVAFARLGFRVFAPDYRLAPEHLFPAAVEDAVECYRGLVANVGAVSLAGDSAGGGLATALMVLLRDKEIPLPDRCVLFSPWTDLAATGDSIRLNDGKCSLFHGGSIARWAKYYLGETDARHPMASPLYADLQGLPPMLIHVGANEVLLDDSVRLAERVRVAGGEVTLKVWPVVAHGWQLVKMIPEAGESVREAGEFLLGVGEKLDRDRT